MGLLDRIGLLLRANLNDVVSKAEDPGKILEQTVNDMTEDMTQLRQAVALAIASQKRLEQQYLAAQGEANKWQQNAQKALQNDREDLAREALTRKNAQQNTATELKTQLDRQTTQVDILKKQLVALESKISEARTKKDMLKARINAAQATEKIGSMASKINANSSAAAFERMEEKVLMAEAKSGAVMEIAGDSLESQFAALGSASDVDAELAAMKAGMLGGSPTPAGTLPAASTAPAPGVDAELEALKQQIDHL